MKYIFLIVYVYIQIEYASALMDYNSNDKLNQYLVKQFEYNNLLKSSDTVNKKESHNLEIQYLGNVSHSGAGHCYNVNIFTLFNSTYLLKDNELYEILKRDNFGLEFQSNILGLHNYLITFFIAEVYEDFGLLIIGLPLGETQVYQYSKENKEFKHIQSIQNQHTTGAHMFVNQNNLHLIIINNKGTSIIIYKWMSTYFDEMESFNSNGITEISSFPSGKSQIVIVLKKLPDCKIFSDVYEFHANKLKKIQKLTTNNPTQTASYVSHNETYVVIWNKKKNNQLFLWNGNQLIEKTSFQTKGASSVKSNIIYNFTTPILLTSRLNSLDAYSPHDDSITLIGTGQYASNYSKILALHGDNHNKNRSVVFIVGLSEDNKININIMTFKIHSTEMESHLQENDVLQQCFTNLEQKVYSDREKLNNLEDKTKTILWTNKTIQFPVRDNLQSAAFTDSNKFNSKLILSQSPEKLLTLDEIKQTINDVQFNIVKVNSTISELVVPSNKNIILNGKTFIKGSITANELQAKNIDIKKLNNKKWVPEQWLLYSQPQTVTGPVTAKEIVTQDLETSRDIPKFNDLLLAKGNQELIGFVSVHNLTATNVYLNKINDIEFSDIYLRSQPKTITGLKQFNNLNVSEATVKTINKKQPGDVLSLFTDSISSKITFAPNMVIDNLWVERIDDINWDDFKNSVFKIGVSNTIHGNLTFNDLKSDQLYLEKLQGVNVGDFLTTSTDQTIASDLEFNRIFAENITAKTVNNISLRQTAATIHNCTIHGPVKIDKLLVEKDLKLIGDFDITKLLMNGDHIIGTNQSDLLQIYNGKVTIKGNLNIKNLELLPEARINLSDKEIDPNIIQHYWTKSKIQKIPVHFEAQNGISSPHLTADSINGVRIPNFMLNNDELKLATQYFFENVTVNGNVLLNMSTEHLPDLEKIDREAVKTTGSFVITGKKTYKGKLRAKNLVTNELGGINVYNTLTTKNPVPVTGTKFFKNLIVKGNFLSDMQSVNVINDVNIKELQNNTLYVDMAESVDQLNFENITVNNLYSTRVNGHVIDEYISKLEKMYTADIINNLYIDGNVTINTVRNVSTINNIDVENLLSNELQLNEDGFIKGIAKFPGTTKINKLNVKIINDIDFAKLTERILYRNLDQEITGHYTFTKLKSDNIWVPKINNLSVEALIDVTETSTQEINAPNGIRFTSPVKFQTIEAETIYPCDLKEAYSNLRYPSRPTKWTKMVVAGNVTFLNQEGLFSNIFEKAVTTNTKNIITAPVKSQSFSADNIFTKHLINGVDLQAVLDDALLKDSAEEQLVTGQQIFPQIRASGARVIGNADIPIVNNILIAELDKAIIDKDYINNMVITGRKTFFNGLQTKRFFSKYVANFEPKQMVSLENPEKIPSAIFDYFEVDENLNVTFINDIKFDDILNNRLLLNSTEIQFANATFFFDNIDINNNLKTPAINDIKISDVVIDEDEQIIQSAKHFTNDVNIVGNAKIVYLNGLEVSETYEKAIIFGENTEIEGSIRILSPSQLDGNVETKNINGYPVASIKEILNQGTTKAEADVIRGIIYEINKIVKECFPIVEKMSTEYMYLERSSDLQVALKNTVNAKSILTNDHHVLLHITGEESGEHCGLPENCLCPFQHTINISPEHSVNDFMKKGYQRVFSYNDDGMIIHFMTNSISTDTHCRKEKAKVLNEISHMTWNTVNAPGRNGTFYMYPGYFSGYISGAEFFTLHNITYMIIGRYYDAVLDTHDLNCILIKFNEDKTAAEEIQEIPTKGAWTLHLFHTAQGVNLIIGNVQSESHEQPLTQIYRFNENTYQFEILRVIESIGCTAATGIVLGTDSFIVLASEDASINSIQKLIIFRYHPYYDTYYYFQNIEVDAPVTGLSVFYTEGFGISDAYMCIVTEYSSFYIYSFKFIDDTWNLESSGEIEGLRNLIPFQLNNKSYLFAATKETSSLLSVVKHGGST